MRQAQVKHKTKGVLTLNFPTNWNELTQKQLLYIGKYWESWLSLMKIGESMRKARSLLMLELCGLETHREKRWLCTLLADVDENTDVSILDLTNFVFDTNDLTINLLPKMKVGMFTWYYGPNDRLNDISIIEFSFAFGCYSQYMATRNETFLNKLVAVLYRPRNENYEGTGEIKAPFNNKLIPFYERKVSRLSDAQKQAVLLFFIGCMEHLAKKYPVVFRRSSEDQKSGGSFVDTVVAMSGGKFGPFDQTRQENLYVVLKELERLIKESEEIKRKSKSRT